MDDGDDGWGLYVMYVGRRLTYVISFFSDTWRGSFGPAPFFLLGLRKITLNNQEHLCCFFLHSWVRCIEASADGLMRCGTHRLQTQAQGPVTYVLGDFCILE